MGLCLRAATPSSPMLLTPTVRACQQPLYPYVCALQPRPLGAATTLFFPGTFLSSYANIGSAASELSASRESFAPEVSLKIDAIESGYAVPLIRLNLHVRCIDLSIRPRRSAHERGGLPNKPKAPSVNGSKSPLAHCFRGAR